MSTVFRARWVLPIAQPPIADGWVAVDAGRILALGGPDDPSPACDHEAVLDGAILPGLVNAHTHLELSWMRNRVPPAPSMPEWVGRMLALRRMAGREPIEPMVEAIHELRAAGTTLIGDIGNTFAAYQALADSDLSAAVFRELLGFGVTNPEAVVAPVRDEIAALQPCVRLRPSIVPHAPYSVSPSLLRAIGIEAGERRLSIHVGESVEEVEFLRSGQGPWRNLLVSLGAWNDDWKAPGTGPVEYIAGHGLVNDHLLAVHCVQLTGRELARLANAGATVVTCPRSNRWTGAGLPPVERFYASGVRVAVGTDSLASVEDLNLFEELKLIRQLAPSTPARTILASATKHGADALGFGDDLGTIEPGKRAELIVVSLPAEVEDVEECLTQGIRTEDIRWVEETKN